MYPHLHIHTFSAHINTRTQAKVTETYIHTHILTHSHTHTLTYSQTHILRPQQSQEAEEDIM